MSPTSAVAPLFGAIPGGAELLLFLPVLVVPLGLAIWVGLNAREHTDHPFAWGLTVLVAGVTPPFIGAIAVTALYLLSRKELGSHAPPTFSEDEMDDDTMVLGQRLGDQRQERSKSGDDGTE